MLNHVSVYLQLGCVCVRMYVRMCALQYCHGVIVLAASVIIGLPVQLLVRRQVAAHAQTLACLFGAVPPSTFDCFLSAATISITTHHGRRRSEFK